MKVRSLLGLFRPWALLLTGVVYAVFSLFGTILFILVHGDKLPLVVCTNWPFRDGHRWRVFAPATVDRSWLAVFGFLLPLGFGLALAQRWGRPSRSSMALLLPGLRRQFYLTHLGIIALVASLDGTFLHFEHPNLPFLAGFGLAFLAMGIVAPFASISRNRTSALLFGPAVVVTLLGMANSGEVADAALWCPSLAAIVGLGAAAWLISVGYSRSHVRGRFALSAHDASASAHGVSGPITAEELPRSLEDLPSKGFRQPRLFAVNLVSIARRERATGQWLGGAKSIGSMIGATLLFPLATFVVSFLIGIGLDLAFSFRRDHVMIPQKLIGPMILPYVYFALDPTRGNWLGVGYFRPLSRTQWKRVALWAWIIGELRILLVLISAVIGEALGYQVISGQSASGDAQILCTIVLVALAFMPIVCVRSVLPVGRPLPMGSPPKGRFLVFCMLVALGFSLFCQFALDFEFTERMLVGVVAIGLVAALGTHLWSLATLNRAYRAGDLVF